MIDAVLNVWPRGKRVEFLVTCGGFVQFDWPKDITMDDVKDSWNPDRKVQNVLIREAERCARLVLTKPIINRLKKITDCITLGVDTRKDKISMSATPIGKLHAELVLLFDVKNDRCYWTGKSYPTPGQQKSLIRITDHGSHFVNLNGQKILLLGCHDLNIFNNRNLGGTSARRLKIKNEIRSCAARWKPTIVLHHPHSTVKVKTWSNGWSYIKRSFPSVELFAGAGCFYEPTRMKANYDDLKKVLSSTKLGSSIDFVVW